ncbi:MAG: IS200/IS605 family transposase [Roseiflexaceae bacterium]|nr:IS200/IS605 family transposase [Roseiflexaceae bacterium]
MPFWRVYYHLIWATKYRQPSISATVEALLYPELQRRASTMDVLVYASDGYVDHVHMVVSIPPKLAVADVIRQFKGGSAHAINATMPSDPSFQWQRGYGVLSIGERQRPIVESYVRNQKQHHSAQSLNNWLEHSPDDDDPLAGPQLREQPEIYQIGDIP